MKNFLAGLFGKDPKEIYELEEIFNQKTGKKNINIFTGDETAFLSSRPIKEKKDLIIALDGYLLDQSAPPEELIARLYAEEGLEFPKHIHGSYRASLFDVEKDRIYLITDKLGSKSFYFSYGDGIAFSSSLPALLRHSDIENQLDKRAAVDFLRCGLNFCGGTRTLIKGVQKAGPSHIIRFGKKREGIKKQIYWNPHSENKRSISDEDALRRIEGLLKESAEKLIKASGDPNVLLSGGFDSTFITSFLKEKHGTVNTYTIGLKDEHFEAGKEMAKEIGTNHHEIKLSYSLPDKEWMWECEKPAPVFLYKPSHQILDKTDINYVSDGETSNLGFPTEGGQSLMRLEKMRFLHKPVRFLRKIGIYNLLCRTLGRKFSVNTSILGSPYESAVLTKKMGTGNHIMSALLSDEFEKDDYSAERNIDKVWNLPKSHLFETYNYLELRRQETGWVENLWQRINHVDFFGYPPILEFTFSLPWNQRRGRRLLKGLAKERVPDWKIKEEPSGVEWVARKLMKGRLFRNKETKDKVSNKISKLVKRDFIHTKNGAKILLNPDTIDWRWIFFITCAYLLEIWIETFIERNEPWTHP